MALNARKVKSGGGKSGNFPLLEAGTYPARLAQVISLGSQPQSYMGESKPPKDELMLTYELVDEFGKDDKGEDMPESPRWISERMPLNNLDSEKAKSTSRYFALDPKEVYEGDWAQLLSFPVNVTLNVSKCGKYNNVSITTAMRPKEAEKTAELVNEPKLFDLDNPDATIFGSLPKWVQGLITGSLGFEGSDAQAALQEGGAEAKSQEEKATEEDNTNDEKW